MQGNCSRRRVTEAWVTVWTRSSPRLLPSEGVKRTHRQIPSQMDSLISRHLLFPHFQMSHWPFPLALTLLTVATITLLSENELSYFKSWQGVYWFPNLMFVCAYMYIPVYVCAHFLFPNMFVHICLCVCVSMWTNFSACVLAYTHVDMTCACMHMWLYICVWSRVCL